MANVEIQAPPFHSDRAAPAITPIRRLLIANRGEIARRVIRSAKRMGIETVAVYADADAGLPFAREADRAIALGGNTPAQTYLDIAKLVSACARSGADAVHPGYGFLSENADFAQALIDSGLIWVGPAPESIRRIGDKLAAKRLMNEIGVPTLAAHEISAEILNDSGLTEAAAAIGYPVLIKASAGGGGRGMRVVENPTELTSAIESARREAIAAFGDGTVFLERWLSRSRHVEIQLLGDRHGNLLHLFERECSIQRRHQKIIEEAPSPAMDNDLRERMGNAALAAARAIGYYSTGTAEFLLSGRDFYFLEVNTRLQVEHPVTEAITGVDLVREQIRVAEGEALAFAQADLSISGHAIEARLCAENPVLDFLPSPGKIEVFKPPDTDGLRVDAGIESGSEIGINFDPMIAKFIAHAPTRREAAALLARALETTQLHGIVHNRDYLVACLRAAEFMAADTTTDFVERVALPLVREADDDEFVFAAISAALHGRARRRHETHTQTGIPGGFRNSLMPAEFVHFRGVNDDAPEWHVRYRVRRDGRFRVDVNGLEFLATVHGIDRERLDIDIDGRRQRLSVRVINDRQLIHSPAGDIELIELPRFPQLGPARSQGGLMAPMPGKVLSIVVSEGASIDAGSLILILEAMKMEHQITAPGNGKIKAIKVREGDQVENGALLVEFAPGDAD